jgi:hypothetical protein
MAQEPHIYVIDPEQTDPGLIRSMTALGEVETPPPRARRQVAVKRARRVEPRPVNDLPPPRPWRSLTGAYLAGPLGLLVTGRARDSNRATWIAALAPVLLMAGAVTSWLQAERLFGPRELSILAQTAFLALAGAAWVTAWSTALLRSGRACKAGLPSWRGRRRPFVVGVLGLLAPGLGLLLLGSFLRGVLSLVLVSLGGLAAVVLLRAATFWSWHQAAADPLLTGLQLEAAFLTLGGLVAAGLLAWLISAFDGARLASLAPAGRRRSSADRVAVALLVALIALAIFFRPLDVARELDRTTNGLAVGGLRLIPLWTAQAAVVLAPGEPEFALRLADRHEALGRNHAAEAIRQDLAGRWGRYLRFHATVDRPDVVEPASHPHSPIWQAVDGYDLLPLTASGSSAPMRSPK